jgi:hypothetical protein
MKEEILGFESRGSADKTRPGRPNANQRIRLAVLSLLR